MRKFVARSRAMARGARAGLVLGVALAVVLEAAVPREASADEGKVRATIDGEETWVWVGSRDGSMGPVQPADLLYLPTFAIERGDAKALVFRTKRGRLWQRGDDGTERLVGAVAAGEAAKDTFSGLSDAELSALRCVRFVRPTAVMIERMARLDLAHVVLIGELAEDDPVPPLPAGTRVLMLGGGRSHEGPRDLSGLAELHALEWLDIGRQWGGPTDFSPFGRLERLRVLYASGRKPQHLEALSRLTGLRALDLSGSRDVPSLEFLRGMAGLRRIDLRYAEVNDLAPLADLPHLEEVDVRGRWETHLDKDEPPLPLARIAPGPWPALRSLRLLGAAVPPAEVEAFRKAHPACRVEASGAEALRDAARGADRLRVRSNRRIGHGASNADRTVFETRAPGEIAAFLDLVRLGPTEFHGLCRCMGEPAVELYAGGELLLILSVHHGRSLRWRGWGGDEWPGDAALAPDAADALAAWFAARGDVEPLAEVEAARRDETAARHREERIAVLLPESVRKRLAPLTLPWREAEPVLVEAVPDRAARILLALRLRGLERGGLLPDGVSVACRDVLDTEKEAILDAALTVPDDVEVWRGVAAIWGGDGHAPDAADARTDNAMGRVMRLLLEDPRPEEQRSGVWTAASRRDPGATALLRRYVETRADAVLRLGAKADTWRRAAAWNGVDALLETGDAEAAVAVRALAVAWPLDRDAVEAQARRVARELELLPKDVRDALVRRRARDPAAQDPLARVTADPKARAILCFRLLAIGGQGSQGPNTGPAWDAADDTLSQTPVKDVVAAARSVLDDDEAAVGVGRWFLREPRGVDEAVIAEILARVAPRMLASPNPWIRRETVDRLASIDAATAIPLLRRLLPTSDAGKPVVAPPPGSDEGDLLAMAIQGLLQLRDRDSVPRIREIAAARDAETRKEIEKAIAGLEDNDDR